MPDDQQQTTPPIVRKDSLHTRITRRAYPEFMTAADRHSYLGGIVTGRMEEQEARSGHPDVCCTGRVNGVGERDKAGAYVKIIAVWPTEARQEMVISRGAAEALIAELQGALA